MYYNKNIKNLLFGFSGDINYNCWLIMYILKVFKCTNSRDSFKDYRKINLIINFILDDYSIDILTKFFNNEKLSDYELNIFSFSYFKCILEENTVNSALLILEKKKLINIYKTKTSVNVYCDKAWLENNYGENIKIEKNIKDKINKIVNEKKKIYKLQYNKILRNIHEMGEKNEEYHY